MNKEKLQKQELAHLSKYRNNSGMRMVKVGEEIKTGDIVVTCIGSMMMDHNHAGHVVTKDGPSYRYGYYFRAVKEDNDAGVDM